MGGWDSLINFSTFVILGSGQKETKKNRENSSKVDEVVLLNSREWGSFVISSPKRWETSIANFNFSEVWLFQVQNNENLVSEILILILIFQFFIYGRNWYRKVSAFGLSYVIMCLMIRAVRYTHDLSEDSHKV